MSTMGYEYPAKPDYNPAGPEMDGMPDIVVGEDYLEFTLNGGHKVRLPGIAIHKDTFRVKRGGNDMVNLLQVEFLAGKIRFEENVMWTEVVPNKPKVSVEGAALALKKPLRGDSA